MKAAAHHNEEHSRLVHALRLSGAKEPDVILWPNSKGTMRNGRYVSLPGLTTGASDLIGMAAGRFLAIEVKTGVGRATDEQLLFLKLVNLAGGYGCIVRSEAEGIEAMRAAKRGDRAPELPAQSVKRRKA